MANRPPSEDRGTQRRRDRNRPRYAADKAVGFVSSLLGLLVVAASVPTPTKTGVVAMTGVLLGMFGYLLGSRWLGSITILSSTTAILLWFLA